jgi:histone demethylase JARID1
LYKCVNLRGGFIEVCKRKLWAQIGRELGYSGKIMTSLSTSLKSTYNKLLYPFDQFVEANGGYEKASQQLKTDLEISILQKEFLPYVDTLTLFPGETIYNTKIKREGVDLDIHQEPESAVIKKLKMLDHNVAILYNCGSDKHLTDVYSVSCSSTPIIRTREARISSSLPTAPTDDKEEEQPWHHGLDKLSSSVHLFPESPTYNLRQFQIKADLVFDEIFGVKTDEEREKISEDHIEKVYWDLFNNKDRLLEVEFGADISTAVHGSGFQQVEGIDGFTPESLHPWNLNVLPFCKGSIFNYIEEDVPYFYKPYIDVGMVFTTRSWQSSDFFTNNVSYNHFGSTRTHYSIPERHFERFQNFIRMKLGEARVENFPDLLLEPNIMINPSVLKENGIDCYVMDQRQGEFVITFPKSHTCSFNHGFNMTETVKFGLLDDWIDLGLDCANLYMQNRIPPPFSIERLIITSAKNELEEVRDTGKQLTFSATSKMPNYLRNLCDVEIKKREMLRQKFDLLEYRDSSNKNWTCSLTNAACFMSYIVDENSRVISIESFLMNPDKKSKLVLGVSDEDLDRMAKLARVKQPLPLKSNTYDQWLSQYEAFIKTTSHPRIDQLNDFLDQGLCIDGPEQPAVTALREFMSDVNDLAKDIKKLLQYPSDHFSDIQLDRRPDFSYFQALIDRACKIPVFFPDLGKLMHRGQEIKEFTSKAEKFLEAQPCDYERLEELLDEGNNFNLNLPIIELLLQQLRRNSWEFNAEMKRPVMNLEELEDAIQSARTMGVPDTEEQLQKLLEMREKGKRLDHEINTLLTGDNQMTFKQFEQIVEKSKTQSIHRDTSLFLLEMYNRYKTIEKEIAMLTKETAAPQLMNRPDFEYVNKIVQQIKIFNCEPTNTKLIEKYLEQVTNWLQEGLELFELKGNPIAAVKQQLHAITKRNDACFKFEPTSVGLLQKPNEVHCDGYEPVCFCHSADLRSVAVSCRVCREKYHRKCLRFVKPLKRDVREIICPLCRTDYNDPTGQFETASPDSPRIDLARFEKWVSTGEVLPLKCVEVLLGQRIVTKAHEFMTEAWRRIDCELTSGGPYLDSMQTQARINFFKSILRRLIGAELELDTGFEANLRNLIDDLDRGPSKARVVQS